MSTELIELYKENGISYRYFLDWRYKIFHRFGILLAISLVISKFIYENHNLNGQVLAIPSILLFIGTVMFLIMDLRIARVSKSSAIFGKSLEKKLLKKYDNIDKGFYGVMLEDREEYKMFTISNTFKSLYILFSILSITLFILALLNPEFTVIK